MRQEKQIVQAYEIAKGRYAELGVDTDKALHTLSKKSISLHCWQGDDVAGFEQSGGKLSGEGIQTTGNYPGKARTIEELRADLDKALSLIPGSHRVNLHAIYGEFGGKTIRRDKVETTHFSGWIDWAKKKRVKLDFNASLFSHPLASDGFTLSSKNNKTRRFWIDHVRQCRAIAADMGKALGSAAVHNLWIPDGTKDSCVDKIGYRELLKDSLDKIYSKKFGSAHLLDAVEPKLFGIGSESFVVGSHEFYMGYALHNNLIPCLDMGHFHPTESIADKISSLLLYSPALLLHVSRGVRWDSDHVVVCDDALRDVMAETVRADALDRVHIALDYFDASINRIGAWVTGAHASLKALLFALCEPTPLLRKYEADGNLFGRLALLEELKAMPFGAIWDYHCLRRNVPVAGQWIGSVLAYEAKVLSKRI